MSTYTSIHLAKRPKDNIIPGETFFLKTSEHPKEADLKDGEVLLQSLYLSLDPSMRPMLNGRPSRRVLLGWTRTWNINISNPISTSSVLA